MKISNSLLFLFFLCWLPPLVAIEGNYYQQEFITRLSERANSYHESQKMPVLSDIVQSAFTKVPRLLFVPMAYRHKAYDFTPIHISHKKFMTEPYLAALMTQLLDIQPTDIVLEIGTGTGYHAAILSHIAHKVYSIEIIPEIAKMASERLEQMSYDNIFVQLGDGNHGWQEHAPFDAILLTAAVTKLPQALIQQLKIGGGIVGAVGNPGYAQMLTVYRKKKDGRLEKRKVLPVKIEFLES